MHPDPDAHGPERRRHARVRMLVDWRVTVWHPNGAAAATIANISVSGVALRVADAFPRTARGSVVLVDVADPDGTRIAEDVGLVCVGEARSPRGARVLRARFLGPDGAALVRAIRLDARDRRRSAA